MKNFLFKIITYTVSFILFIYLCQFAISFHIQDKYINGHDNLLQTSNINAELVFIGSSRCLSHFDPIFFEKTFNIKNAVNIGVEGHSGIAMAKTRLEDYLLNNVSPKYAIFSFDPFTSAGSFTNNTNMVSKNKYARYAFTPSNNNWKIVDIFKFNKYEKYIPLYAIFKYQILSDCIFSNNLSAYVKYGYQRHDKIWDTIKQPINSKMRSHFFKIEDKPSIKSALKQLNEFCIMKNIKLICIQTPVHLSIYSKIHFNLTGEICSELDITFINACVNSISNNTFYFYDSNHMNINGIEKMNSFLKDSSVLMSILSPKGF